MELSASKARRDHLVDEGRAERVDHRIPQQVEVEHHDRSFKSLARFPEDNLLCHRTKIRKPGDEKAKIYQCCRHHDFYPAPYVVSRICASVPFLHPSKDLVDYTGIEHQHG